jgi:hypothetical protein
MLERCASYQDRLGKIEEVLVSKDAFIQEMNKLMWQISGDVKALIARTGVHHNSSNDRRPAGGEEQGQTALTEYKFRPLEPREAGR